jgi:hypothetical protein
VPLGHPTPNAAIALATDASDTHIGGPLQQQVQGSWQPLGFFSRKLQPAESKYSTFDWELHAAVADIRHFRHILAGRDFQLIGHSTHTCFRTMVSQAAATPGRHRRIYWTGECGGGRLVKTSPLFAGPDQDAADQREARNTLSLYACRKRRQRPQRKRTPLIFRTWPPNRLPVIDRTSRWTEALPWLTPPRQRSRRHYFQGGFAGLVYQPSSHLTEEHNLPPIFGIHCVFCCRSGTSQQLHTTHRPMGWWRDYTAA